MAGKLRSSSPRHTSREGWAPTRAFYPRFSKTFKIIWYQVPPSYEDYVRGRESQFPKVIFTNFIFTKCQNTAAIIHSFGVWALCWGYSIRLMWQKENIYLFLLQIVQMCQVRRIQDGRRVTMDIRLDVWSGFFQIRIEYHLMIDINWLFHLMPELL